MNKEYFQPPSTKKASYSTTANPTALRILRNINFQGRTLNCAFIKAYSLLALIMKRLHRFWFARLDGVAPFAIEGITVDVERGHVSDRQW